MVNELVRNRDNPPWDVAIGIPEFYYTVLIEKDVLYCPGIKIDGVPADRVLGPARVRLPAG